MSKILITIDGASGTGKSSVATLLAKQLKLPCHDTGAIYRSITYRALQLAIPLEEAALQKMLQDFRVHIEHEGEKKRYWIEKEEVTDKIRSHHVNQHVSHVSSFPCVREFVWFLQKKLGKEQGGVFEGRDMGSVVFPQEADFKFFLTTDPHTKALRRFKELGEEKCGISLEELEKQMVLRDKQDKERKLGPLICPEGAHVIDTSSLSLQEVVQTVIQRCSTKTWIEKRKSASKSSLLYKAVLGCSWLIGKLFFRLKVYGEEHFYAGGAFIASNHTSFLDPPILAVAWPEQVHFMARDSLFHPPWFGRLLRALNAHPLKREGGDWGAFKKAKKLAEEGHKVIVFPEGRRSTGNLEKAKRGLALLMEETEGVCIPAYIEGANRALEVGKKWPRLFTPICVVFGPSLMWSQFKHLPREEAHQAFSAAWEKSVYNLKAWVQAGAKGPINPIDI